MQDLIFSVGSLIFIAALSPMLKMPWNQKPAVYSALLTGTVLTVFGVTYATLDLKFASITTFITASIWFTLAWQKTRLTENVTIEFKTLALRDKLVESSFLQTIRRRMS
jgi:hypothetical protein